MSVLSTNQPQYLNRIGHYIWGGALTLQRSIVVVLGIYTIILMVMQVIFRYFLNVSLMWTEEFILYMVFWFYLIGASLCAHEGTHLHSGAAQIFLRNHPRILNSIKISAALLSVGLSILFTFWGFSNFTWALEVHHTSLQARLLYPYAMLSLVLGFALMAVYFLAEAVNLIRANNRL